VNPGSEPERDNTGLPPVDVEIPDDARELDRDVQAYYREQRAERRNLRSRRLHRVLSRDSMVVPLLICCLVFALISGTLLTLFTATSIDNMPGQGASAGSLTLKDIVPAPQLSGDSVAVAGNASPLGSIRPVVLLMIPPNCASCDTAARQVARLAMSSQVSAYVLYRGSGFAQAGQLANEIGAGTARDVTGQLVNGHTGLTAFLVSPGGAVSYAQQLQAKGNLNQLLPLAQFGSG